MDSLRWQLIERHFHDLVDRPHAEQAAGLRELELTDAKLADEVRAMIDADLAGQTILNRNPGTIAFELLVEPSTLPTSEFGPYRISALLGEGGMGVVYLGKRADLNSQAAIKVLRDAWLSPSRRERFLTEQRTLASLEHVGIARLLDADRLPDGTPWFAMEYVEGIAISEYCWQQKLSLSARLALFAQACDAVRFAHERGVIHRDIKPSNVLVNRDGQVKLLDFGIAKTLRAADGPIDLTQTQQRMLTPAYASPEQLRGAVIGVQTDVFSLGVLLYEMLSGVRPYRTDGLSAGEAAKHIETESAERLSVACRKSTNSAPMDLNSSTRSDLDALVACAIHPDTVRRYRNADALLSDLTRFERQQPLAAQPDSTRYRLQKFLARHWKAAAMLTLAVGIGTVGAVSYTRGINAARLHAETEATRVTRLKDFLVSMFDGGDEAAGPNDALRVSDLINTGIRESRSRTTDPTLQADLFGVLGFAAGRIGKPAIADTLLHEALRLQRKIHGAESEQAISASITLASYLKDVGQADSALALYRGADSVARRQLPMEEPTRALAAEQLGLALGESEQIEPGIALLQEAISLRAAVDSTNTEYANAVSALANVTYYGQQFARSETLNLKVIQLANRTLGVDHPSTAENYLNLGALASKDGRFADHERWARKALAVIEGYYGPDDSRTAGALKQVGQALTNLERYAEAEPILRRALAVQERALGANSAPVASTLNSLSLVEEHIGHRDVAVAMLTRALGIYRQVYGEAHSTTFVTRVNIAAMLQHGGQLDSAAQLVANLVRDAEKSLTADNQDLAVFRIRLGRMRLLQRRFKDVIGTSTAGLLSLEKSSSEPTGFSRGARKDLHASYLALGDTVNAQKFVDPDGRLSPMPTATSNPPPAAKKKNP